MTDIILPPALEIARTSINYVENTGSTRGGYNGVLQTTGYSGDRVTASIDFTLQGGASTAGRSKRAQMLAFLMAIRGRQNRVILTDPAHSAPRGSFPATELLTNGTFTSTTGWTASSCTLTAADNVLRATASTGAGQPIVSQNVSVTLGVAYALRGIFHKRKTASNSLSLAARINDGTATSAAAYSDGYYVNSLVAAQTGTASVSPMFMNNNSGFVAGDHYDLALATMARCLLVDGGGCSTLRTQEIDHAAWSSVGLGSVSANAIAAPDGTSTAEILVQDTSSGGHYRHQTYTVPSAAADFTASASFKAANRGWAFILMEEQTGGQSCYAFVNLTTGAIGTVTSSTNMASARGFVVSRGDGWHDLHLVARKTNAATQIQVRVCAATADNTLTYSGSAENAIAVWRAGGIAGSVPTRGAVATSAAVAAETQSGTQIFVKALPVSTAGLLVVGDEIEIDGQIKFVTARLDSDAAGRGRLEFSPPLYREVADNTPVCVHIPMGRFVVAGGLPGWITDPGITSTASIELEEAFA